MSEMSLSVPNIQGTDLPVDINRAVTEDELNITKLTIAQTFSKTILEEFPVGLSGMFLMTRKNSFLPNKPVYGLFLPVGPFVKRNIDLVSIYLGYLDPHDGSDLKGNKENLNQKPLSFGCKKSQRSIKITVRAAGAC